MIIHVSLVSCNHNRIDGLIAVELPPENMACLFWTRTSLTIYKMTQKIEQRPLTATVNGVETK